MARTLLILHPAERRDRKCSFACKATGSDVIFVQSQRPFAFLLLYIFRFFFTLSGVSFESKSIKIWSNWRNSGGVKECVWHPSVVATGYCPLVFSTRLVEHSVWKQVLKLALGLPPCKLHQFLHRKTHLLMVSARSPQIAKRNYCFKQQKINKQNPVFYCSLHICALNNIL